MTEELDNIRNILNENKIKFEEDNNEFYFKILKREIKIEFENERIITSILNYDGLNPLCHVSYIENQKKGIMCLDSNINAYHTNSFKSNYLDIIKEIILEKNHLDDSFNELEIQIGINKYGRCLYKKIKDNELLFIENFQGLGYWLMLNNIKTLEIEWEGFRFRNYKQLFDCIKNEKIDWNQNNLIIFKHNKLKKWIFIPQDSKIYNIIYLVENVCDPQTLMNKTGAKVKENILIVIVGLGSLGSEIFERFRLAGHINFILIDFDQLKSNNGYRWAYPTLPTTHHDLFKVKLIKTYFYYLNIIIFKKHVKEMNIEEIDLSEFKNEINKLIFIDATAKKSSEMISLKLWYELCKKYKFNQSTYKLTFLEDHGLALHTFSINYSNNNFYEYFSYGDELKSFSEMWKQNKILKFNKKYIYQNGCVNETQIYSQNSTKKLTIDSTHLLQQKNQKDYIKINLLSDLINDKKREWSEYYKKNKNNDTNEIDIE